MQDVSLMFDWGDAIVSWQAHVVYRSAKCLTAIVLHQTVRSEARYDTVSVSVKTLYFVG
jgi:hypothetical protein